MRKPDQRMGKAEKTNSTNNNANKIKLRKGLWSPEEDDKLMGYMLRNGQGCWSDIARNAGLLRCGKSCRLRWINYLRPDLKRGAFSPQEEELIVHLHSILGNRWSQIAARLPGRTDNEIKNFWNSTIKKRLKNANFISSQNSSHDLSDPTNNIMGGIILSGQEQEIMAMLMDSSSISSSINNTATKNTSFNPFPNLLENPYDLSHGLPNGNFENNIGICGEFGGFQQGVIGLERHISITQLESGVISVDNNGDFDEKIINNNHLNSNGEVEIKVEDMFGYGNKWQGDNLKMGEWDFEGLLENVSSFPNFLDFQVE